MVGTEVLEKEPGGGTGWNIGRLPWRCRYRLQRIDDGGAQAGGAVSALAEPSLSEEEKQALTEEFISLSRALRRG